MQFALAISGSFLSFLSINCMCAAFRHQYEMPFMARLLVRVVVFSIGCFTMLLSWTAFRFAMS